MRRLGTAVALACLLAACGSAEEPADTPANETSTTTPATPTTERPLPTTGQPQPDFELTSPAFAEDETIPVKYTCDGQNISPKLEIRNAPAGAVTLAIIMDDPDAPVGVWDHWVEYDIPTEPGEVVWPEGVGRVGTQGVNSWNLPGYGGPCPPPGQEHRYFFTIYALDTELLLPEGVDSAGLRDAMEGHVVGEAVLMGVYAR